MATKEQIKKVKKMLENEEIDTEQLLSNEFFKEYTEFENMAEFEEEIEGTITKNVKKEDALKVVLTNKTKFKDLADMQEKAINFYIENDC
ncbi:hypothetical protein [Cetobacterium sp.]|uniref:hypothetical protein n=1 Tax=Cetobacterium sp. TaxID=2071632 RepID=UPI003EE6796C